MSMLKRGFVLAHTPSLMCGCQTQFSAPMIGTILSGRVDICTMLHLHRTGGQTSTGLTPLSTPSTRRGCAAVTLNMVMLSLTGSIRIIMTAGLLFVLTRLMNMTETGNGLGGTEMMSPGYIGAETISHGDTGTLPTTWSGGDMITGPGPGGTLQCSLGTGGMQDHGLGGVAKLSRG